MEDKFITFLKAHSIHDMYITNFNNYSSERNLSAYFKHSHPNNYINNAFTWSATPQGHDFWRAYDVAWDKKVYYKRVTVTLEEV